MLTADQIIDDILRREGSKYTNDPIDRGGPTKFGITLATLSFYRGRSCTAEDVQALTEAEARRIYRDVYVVRPKFDQIKDDALRALVVDWGVNSGPGTAAKALQRAAGVTADGAIGPKTLAAVNAADPRKLHDSVLSQRESFYRRLASEDPSQQRFLSGWLNRCREFELA